MKEIDELAKFTLQRGYNGTTLDSLTYVYSPQLNDSAKFVQINLGSIDDLITMAAPHSVVYVSRDDSDYFVGCALYPFSESCPVARAYIFKFRPEYLKSVCARFEASRLNIHEVPTQEYFDNLISAEDAGARIVAWKKSHTTTRDRAVEAMAVGRHNNTFVKQTEYLRSDTCLFCSKAVSRLMNTNVGVDDRASALMFGLCEEHASEAMSEGFILEYLAKKMGTKTPWDMKEIDPKTDSYYLKECKRLLLEVLGCSLEKEDSKNRELTGLRQSGFRVIVRIQSVHKRGYAYLILDPNGKNVERIDDKPDHLDLPFQFDHRHTGLPKNNKSATPSFTFGHVMADVKAILDIIERAESAYSLMVGK